MQDITVIILTYNESKHIARCINSLKGVVKRIVVVDSFSSDSTLELCKDLGACVYQNKWINYANQFQWGLDNCSIDTQWTMRMDADEYLEPSLINEINSKMMNLNKNINGIYLKRKVIFKGQWIRYGGFYPQILLRIWKTGIGRIEQRWMDEHIVIDTPSTETFNNDLVDENLNNIGWWIEKHNAYASREMIDLLNIKYEFFDQDNQLTSTNDPQAQQKRVLKERIYSRLPLLFRTFIYFLYRYFIKLGFLDGKKGFIFHFMQAFWYRLVVDIKCNEILDLVQNREISKQELIEIIRKETNVNI
jgi:glycosyltransferase involved in cell wall biosynthesis